MSTADVSRDALALVPYDRRFLALSADWLADPETKALTMTPEFNSNDQERFFVSLPERTDYFIWGLEHMGEPIGAAGVKSVVDGSGEYWGYIGVKQLWGQGIGGYLTALVENKARCLGIDNLFLRVSSVNERAMRLYQRSGYSADDEGSKVIVMRKELCK